MGDDPVLAAFLYFYHLDKANAHIHLGEVRFSPITFALAAIFGAHESFELDEVRQHLGQYELDRGR